MAGVGEEGQAHVGEDKVLCNKVKQLKHLPPWRERKRAVDTKGGWASVK